MVYAAASAFVAYLVKPIIDQILPAQSGWSFRLWAVLILGTYLLTFGWAMLREW